MRSTLFYLVFLCSCGLCAKEPALPESWTIQEAEDYALEHNPELRAIREAVEQGQLRALQALARYLPQVGIAGTADRAHHGQLQRYEWKTASTLRLLQRIVSMQDVYNIKLRHSDWLRLQSVLGELKTNLLFAVRSSYYQIVLQQEQVEVQEKNIAILKDEFESERDRFDVGECTQFEVNRSRVAVSNAQTALYSAIRDLKSSRNQFLRLLGIDPDRSLQLSAETIPVESVDLLRQKLEQPELDFAIAQDIVASYEQKALSKNPQIAIARIDLGQASQVLTQRYCEYAPNINLFANYYNSSTPAFSFRNVQSSWDYGIEFQYTFFDGLGRERRIQEARSAKREKHINEERAIREVMVDIHNQFHGIELALQAYVDAKEGMWLAEQSLELARDRRDLGFLTQLEFRDTAQSLLIARLQFNQAQFALLQAYFGLQRATGVDL